MDRLKTLAQHIDWPLLMTGAVLLWSALVEGKPSK